METTEKRELLIAFQQWYNDGMQQDITLYSIDNFISTLPDDGEADEDVEQLAINYADKIDYDYAIDKDYAYNQIIQCYKSAKQSNPNPQ